MHQVIIYWDNGEVEILEAESKPELYKKLEAKKINPEHAIWEFKWVPTKKVITEELIRNTM